MAAAPARTTARGSRSASSPSSIIQPDSVFCGSGSCHLRRSTVPRAQEIAAPRISNAAVGARWKWRMSSPSSSAIPSMPSAIPTIRRSPSGSDKSTSEISNAPHRHRVGEDRAASGRQLLHAEEHEPVPARDVEERERRDLAPQRARDADRIARPMRDGEHAKRCERKRECAKRERRDLGDAHLENRPIATPDQRQHGDRKKRRRCHLRCGRRVRPCG